MKNPTGFWNAAAEKYAKSPIKDMDAYEYTLDRTRSYLGADDRVLELGCGTGKTALLLAPSATHITATDLSDNMIGIGRRKAAEKGVDNVTFEVRDVLAGPTQRDTFNVVTGFNLFHLVPDMEQTFQQIAAMLPQGGYFISKSPCLAQSGGGVKGFAMRALIRIMIPTLQAIGKAPYVRRFTIAELEEAVTKAGFDIIESSNHPAGPPPARYIVARKR